MCRLRNIELYARVTDGRTDRQTDGQTTDKVIPMCHYASQATQKVMSKTLSLTFFKSRSNSKVKVTRSKFLVQRERSSHKPEGIHMCNMKALSL